MLLPPGSFSILSLFLSFLHLSFCLCSTLIHIFYSPLPFPSLLSLPLISSPLFSSLHLFALTTHLPNKMTRTTPQERSRARSSSKRCRSGSSLSRSSACPRRRTAATRRSSPRTTSCTCGAPWRVGDSLSDATCGMRNSSQVVVQ
jgi:hypothetical protein